MNSKSFILGVIALNVNILWAQVVIPRAYGPSFAHSRNTHGYGLSGAAPYFNTGHFGAPGFALPAHSVHALPAPVVHSAGPVPVAHATPIGFALDGYGFRGAHVGHVGHVQHVGPVSAAIETRRTYQVVNVPTSQDVIQPQTLIVEPNVMPVIIEFRSQSSPVSINQVHIPGRPGELKETRSEEEPDRVTHEVVKPVIQEVREVIVPFRRITQEILPVQEEVHGLIARGENHRVIQEVPIPAPVAVPVPPPVHSVAAPVALAQPLAPAVDLVRPVEPVIDIAQPLPPFVAVEKPIAPVEAAHAVSAHTVHHALPGPALHVQPLPVPTHSIHPALPGQAFPVHPGFPSQVFGKRIGVGHTGTIVKAGIVGGTRVFEVPFEEAGAGIAPIDTIAEESQTHSMRRFGQKIRREVL